MTVVARRGGRVILLDPHDRVLLIHERTSDGTHWLTPGGGIEAGESAAQAAVRELFEETGLVVVLDTPDEPVLMTRRGWSWAGVSYDQVDQFFTARTECDVEVVPQALTAAESQTLLGHRWWTRTELLATDETIEPAELADVLARVGAVGA